ncbi:MAG: hypothetical protein Q7T82_16190 [Armatimonadota bacterium]|nr:hypothetical protein [Armatimonadota bacterium]
MANMCRIAEKSTPLLGLLAIMILMVKISLAVDPLLRSTEWARYGVSYAFVFLFFGLSAAFIAALQRATWTVRLRDFAVRLFYAVTAAVFVGAIIGSMHYASQLLSQGPARMLMAVVERMISFLAMLCAAVAAARRLAPWNACVSSIGFVFSKRGIGIYLAATLIPDGVIGLLVGINMGLRLVPFDSLASILKPTIVPAQAAVAVWAGAVIWSRLKPESSDSIVSGNPLPETAQPGDGE